MPRQKGKSAGPVFVVPEEQGEQSTQLLACKHYWIIEPANGPISWGVCQVCGEGKEFKNSIGPEAWAQLRLGDGDVSKGAMDDPNPDDETPFC